MAKLVLVVNKSLSVRKFPWQFKAFLDNEIILLKVTEVRKGVY